MCDVKVNQRHDGGICIYSAAILNDLKEEDVEISVVVPWRIELQSKVPETFILSVVLQDQ